MTRTNDWKWGRILCAALVLLTRTGAALAQDLSAADPDPTRFEADIRSFEAWDRQNSFPRGAILFVGSSSIDKWQTAESFADLPVINRGFGGSHVPDQNYYFDRVVPKYAPRVIIFYCGDNDIAAGSSPQRVFADTQKFVTLVHARLPETRIIYLPIKPSLARWKLWSQMQETNALVRQLTASDPQLEYLDTATLLLGADGRPRPELFVKDGLHLNADGYRLWNDKLRPKLVAALLHN